MSDREGTNLDRLRWIARHCPALTEMERQDVLSASAEIERLRAEANKLQRIHELDRHTISRWVPCSGHRDKTTRGTCYVCENERLRKVLGRLVSNPTDPGALASAQREVADGRAFA